MNERNPNCVSSAIFNLLITKDIEEAVEKIADSNRKRQDRKPMLFEERQPFIAMRQAFVLGKLSEENIAPDGAQSEGDRIKKQPEDDLFCFYLGPVFLFGECDDNFNILVIVINTIDLLQKSKYQPALGGVPHAGHFPRRRGRRREHLCKMSYIELIETFVKNHSSLSGGAFFAL